MENPHVTGIAQQKGFFTLPIFSDKLSKTIPDDCFDRVIQYMDNGHFVFGYMGYINDENGDLTVIDACSTDGLWIWSDYYPYCLKNIKYNKIEPNFLNYIMDNNFLMPEISKERFTYIKKYTDNNSDLFYNTIECSPKEKRQQSIMMYEK